MAINEVLARIKENIKYFINDEDNFEIIVNKTIQKLKDNGVLIKNTGYEILDFKESFSKISFKVAVSHPDESITEDIILVVSNSNFVNNIIGSYKKAVELYLINALDLPLDKFILASAINDETITRKQLSFIMDKMQSRDMRVLVEEYLEENRFDNLEKLSKKSASLLIDKIQSKERKNKRY